MGTICVDEDIATGTPIYPIEHVASKRESMLGVIGSRRDAKRVVAALVTGGFRESEIHLDVAPNPHGDAAFTAACEAIFRSGGCLMAIENATPARTLLAAKLLARYAGRAANFLGWLTDTTLAGSALIAPAAR